MSKNEILEGLFKSRFMDDLIWNITSGHPLKDDLKAELFLILCEMPESKIKAAWKGNWLNYLCVNIIKKQFHSSTSPFHKTWRSFKFEFLEFPQEGFLEGGFEPHEEHTIREWIGSDNENWDIKWQPVLKQIRLIVERKLDLVDRELFKLYYKMDKYDRWIGELRDTACEKQTSSLRKISKKLEITTFEGKKISISKDTIRLSLDRSLMIIKKELENDGWFDFD